MKTFLYIAGAVLAVTIMIVIGLYIYLQILIEKNRAAVRELSNSSSESALEESDQQAVDQTTESSDQVPSNDAAGESPVTPATAYRQPIPLSTLPLTEAQKAMAANVGIDVETFVITPLMITCAENKLGAERFNEIIAGAAPSTLDTLSLLACL